MRKKFLFNLFILFLLNLLVKPFWVFGIDRSFQNQVGLKEYGLFFTVFNFSMFFNILLDLGINNFNTREVSQNKNSLGLNFTNILSLKLILGLLYFLVSFLVAWLLKFDNRYMYLLLLLTVNQLLLSYVQFLRTNLSGLQLYTTDSILSVTNRLFMIVCYILAVWLFFGKHTITVEWFIGIQTIAYILSGITVGIVLFYHTGKIKFTFNLSLSKTILLKSLPYALLIFLMTAYSRVDTIMLERILPDGAIQAGIYAQSFRVLDAVNMIAILFAGLLLPMFANMLASNINIEKFTHMVFNILWIISVSFSIASVIHSNSIIRLLYTEGGNYSSQVFSILLLSFIPVAVINIYGTLLTASGKINYLNKIGIISLLLNVVLNFFIIPHYKASGAAFTSLVTQLFSAIMQSLYVKREFGTLFIKPVRNLLYIILYTMLATIAFYFVNNWIVAFVLAGATGIILAFLIQLISITEIKELYKSYKPYQ